MCSQVKLLGYPEEDLALRQTNGKNGFRAPIIPVRRRGCQKLKRKRKGKPEEPEEPEDDTLCTQPQGLQFPYWRLLPFEPDSVLGPPKLHRGRLLFLEAVGLSFDPLDDRLQALAEVVVGSWRASLSLMGLWLSTARRRARRCNSDRPSNFPMHIELHDIRTAP